MKYKKEVIKPDTLRFSAGANKMASYLEAGIPVITNLENEFNSNITIQNGIGLAVNDFIGLNKKLKDFNYKKAGFF